MNKKRLNIALVPGVFIIWALIAYKIFFYGNKAKIDSGIDFGNSMLNDSVPIRDTFFLFTNYRDPFKPAQVNHRKKSEGRKNTLKPVQRKIIKEVKWPVIQYYGLVRNTDDGNKLALISIADSSLIVKENYEASNIKILGITQDSVLIRFYKEKKYFLRK